MGKTAKLPLCRLHAQHREPFGIARICVAMTIDGFKGDPIVVLLVEGDAATRIATADALTDAGISVLEAETADRAREILSIASAGITLVLAAANLPGSLSGVDLAYHVSQKLPWIAMAVASAEMPLRAEDVPVGCRLVWKPYLVDHPVEHVREIVRMMKSSNP